MGFGRGKGRLMLQDWVGAGASERGDGRAHQLCTATAAKALARILTYLLLWTPDISRKPNRPRPPGRRGDGGKPISALRVQFRGHRYTVGLNM